MNIQTPAEHTAAMERLSALMDAAPTLGSPESDELTGLAESIEAYEARTFPIAMDKGSARPTGPKGYNSTRWATKSRMRD